MKTCLILICVCAALLLSCIGAVPGDPAVLAYVGSIPIRQEDADAFAFVLQNMPGRRDFLGLEQNGSVWALIATEALYQHGIKKRERARIRSGREWKWKRRSYLAKAFEIQMLQTNLGFSDSAIRNYYQTHLNDFMRVNYSENGKTCTLIAVAPFDSIREEAAKRLFLESYNSDSTAVHDLRDPRMFRMFRERLYRDYFMKHYYQEQYGEILHDSLVNDLCGSDAAAMFDTGDVGTVFSWLPEKERESFGKDRGGIIRRMVQWKLFSERAEMTGYAQRSEVRAVLEWAWKCEIAGYVLKSIYNKAKKKMRPVEIDMARFSLREETNMPLEVIDSTLFKRHLERLSLQKEALAIDSVVYSIRRRRGVIFTKPDIWSDGRIEESPVLLKKADAFRDSGNFEKARTLYGILTEYYLFSPEGKKALVEQAKLLADRGGEAGCLEAIKNFRRFLILSDDRSKQCEIMFRIAFVYDRELYRRDMAEINYRWVTENCSGSGFADDAAAMLRQLAEPAQSTEKLRDRA